MRTGVALLVMLSSAVAAADGGQHRYAEQIIASDVTAIGLTVAGGQTQTDPLTGIGIGIGIAGAPLVHLINGNYGGAAGSLALRITLPFASALLGEKLAPSDEGQLKTGQVLGFAAGLAVASVIDASTLAKKQDDHPRSSETLAIRRWTPDVYFKPGGGVVVVRTKF